MLKLSVNFSARSNKLFSDYAGSSKARMNGDGGASLAVLECSPYKDAGNAAKLWSPLRRTEDSIANGGKVSTKCL